MDNPSQNLPGQSTPAQQAPTAVPAQQAQQVPTAVPTQQVQQPAQQDAYAQPNTNAPKPGYAPQQPQAYSQPNTNAPKPGYAPQQQQTYAQPSTDAPKQGYATQQQQTYAQPSTTAPQQGYAPQQQQTYGQPSTTAPQQGYAPQQQQTYGQPSTTAPQQGYAPQQQQTYAQPSTNAPQQGYAPQQQQTYAQPSTNAPQQGYAPQQQQTYGQPSMNDGYTPQQQAYGQPNTNAPQDGYGVPAKKKKGKPIFAVIAIVLVLAIASASAFAVYKFSPWGKIMQAESLIAEGDYYTALHLLEGVEDEKAVVLYEYSCIKQGFISAAGFEFTDADTAAIVLDGYWYLRTKIEKISSTAATHLNETTLADYNRIAQLHSDVLAEAETVAATVSADIDYFLCTPLIERMLTGEKFQIGPLIIIADSFRKSLLTIEAAFQDSLGISLAEASLLDYDLPKLMADTAECFAMYQEFAYALAILFGEGVVTATDEIALEGELADMFLKLPLNPNATLADDYLSRTAFIIVMRNNFIMKA